MELNKKKIATADEELGMSYSSASNRLWKIVFFDILHRHKENVCYRCGREIESVDDLSLEHKKPWLHVDVSLFWDLENTAFSHKVCNSKAIRPNGKGTSQHGKAWTYNRGCRCKPCTKAASLVRAERRKRNG